MHPLVDVETLHRHLHDPSWVVFDCRHDLAAPASGEAMYTAGHIAGARFAHLDRDLSGAKVAGAGRHPLPTRDAFVAFLARSGVGAGSTIAAYDASNGLYAARLWWMAHWVGHAAVVVLDGGLPAWQRAGHALTDVVPVPTPGDIALRPSLVASLETVDVEANLASRTRLVVDARAAERFRGEVEPLDPVAGHIPGAANHPMARSVATDGRLREPSVLRAAFEETFATRRPDEVVQSCGSGVTACFNLLAMEVAGLPGAALYAGSWSAWCADPARPIARGD